MNNKMNTDRLKAELEKEKSIIDTKYGFIESILNGKPISELSSETYIDDDYFHNLVDVYCRNVNYNFAMGFRKEYKENYTEDYVKNKEWFL